MVYRVKRDTNYLTNTIMQMHSKGLCTLVFASANTFPIPANSKIKIVNDTYFEITDEFGVAAVFSIDSIIGVVK